MLRVGLTGSIAVGKSSVCNVFRRRGCHVLDADAAAREVVAAGSIGLKQIVEHFGSVVLQDNGELDRGKLGEIVFADAEKRQLLNSIVHPLVIERQDKWLLETEQKDPVGIAIVDAALMIESGGFRRFDKLIVVWCRGDIQLARLMERDHLSEAEAMARIAAQMPQEEKKKYADYLIDTSGGFAAAEEETKEVFEQLKSLADNPG